MTPTRPTKKQRELLSFIENFIAGHGYGPSYREIMRGLGYKSVSTVANHVDNLIARGHLNKKDNSARSIEVVGSSKDFVAKKEVSKSQEKWLVEQVEAHFTDLESAKNPTQDQVDELYVLVGALKVLGLEGAANAFTPRLMQLKSRAG